MAILAIQPPAPKTLRTTAPDTYIGVHRIICVGLNYADHVSEMGGDAKKDPPVFFMKPPSCAVQSEETIPYPQGTNNLHHEVELAIVIGTGGADIDEADALDHIYGYATGNDLTRRDVQAAAKGTGGPWDMAKGFDNSAIIGPIHPVSDVGHPSSGAIRCMVEGELRQNSDLSQMIWTVPEIIATLSRSLTLQPGDIILTGTPSGIGPIERGQTCVCEIEGLGQSVVTLA